ncbi:MAG: hypothetical protein V1655_01915 [bacterium]
MKKITLILSFFLMSFLVVGCVQVETNSDFGGVFRSVDKGETFLQKSLLATPLASLQSIGNVSVTTMELDPQDSSALYIGTLNSGLYYSYDMASSWQKARSLGDMAIHSLEVSPDNKCRIYAASYNKIFMSKDCNRTYKEIYNDPRSAVIFKELIIDPSVPARIYAATSFGDILRSEDSGTAWMNIYNLGSEIIDIVIPKDNAEIMYVATKKALLKTENNGVNWTNIGNDFDKLAGVAGSMDIREILSIDGKNGNSIMVLTNKNIFKSNNGGASWDNLRLVTPPGKVDLYSFAVNPKNEKEIYYATATSFVKSIDGGANWKSVVSPSLRLPYHMLADPADLNIIYLGMWKQKS